MLSFLNTNNMLENYAYNSILDELNKNNISPLKSLLSIGYWLLMLNWFSINSIVLPKINNTSLDL